MSIGFRVQPRVAASKDLVGGLAGVPTSIASDNMARLFAGGCGLRPHHRGGALLGTAFTVRTRPGDNLMVHKAIDMAEPGDVVVVDAGGDLTNAIIGEIMLSIAARRGLAGFVIDGAVRDTDHIAASPLPVYARGVTHRGPYKDGPGELNGPVSIGGMPVMPGDIIIGDADGVLAIPQAEAAEVARLSRAQMAREQAILASIADGSIDRSWVDATLKARGCML
ncbi:RraA family protein [Phreatobacter sp.]|uniref:RraA family protein n=1 Tax=Phreatobacter sp. TaxID=1966341 RepID=UPI0025EDED4B|nr:RraA family protein [Phreatobacter sp.]